MEEKKTYQKKVEEKLKQLSETVGELTVKAEKLQDDAKAEFHEQIESLHAKQGTMKEKLQKLEEAGDDALDDLKEGIKKRHGKILNEL